MSNHYENNETLRNYETFRDLISSALVERLTVKEGKPRRRGKKSGTSAPSKPVAAAHSPSDPTTTTSPVAELGNPAEELADFIEYIASETFADLPLDLKTLDHVAWAADASLQERYSPPLTGQQVSETILPALQASVAESLLAYGAIDGQTQGVDEFLAPVLSGYVSAVTATPPPPRTTRADACEICGRDWINLSYHHLIPRFVHDKVVRRGWHRQEDLENVAWLCGACHRFVHHFAKHEDLARYYYTVELLLQQQEIQDFAKWVGRLRWKGR